MTIQELNQWVSLYNSMKSGNRVEFEELQEAAETNNLTECMQRLLEDHYIGRMKDGNTFVNWTANRFYPGRDLRALRAKLTNSVREATLEEKVQLLESEVQQLYYNMLRGGGK